MQKIRLYLIAMLTLFVSIPIQATEQPPQPLPLEELRQFTDVFEHIRTSYVEEVDDQTLLLYAVQGMLAGLDPHSSYLDAEALADIQTTTTGEFGGLGMEVSMEDGFVKVIAPLDGTPAQRAGIASGDLITHIDDAAVKGLSLDEAVKLMRGEKGSEVELTIIRQDTGQPFNVTITRDIIKVQSVRSEWLEPGYGYIRIAQFQNDTGAEFRAALDTLLTNQQAPLKGLVIDLRNNPGGVLQSSVDVTDALLTEGLIVYTDGRIDQANAHFTASQGSEVEDVTIVVLINGGSASASEIVAGALQDHRRAVIMGTDSFGKGSVQTIIPINDDSAIKLTTARYYTPDGRSIQTQGIVPDIVVERVTTEPLTPHPELRETDLRDHLQHDDESTTENELPHATSQDNQLDEALNLLKGLHILGGTDEPQQTEEQVTM